MSTAVLKKFFWT